MPSIDALADALHEVLVGFPRGLHAARDDVCAEDDDSIGAVVDAIAWAKLRTAMWQAGVVGDHPSLAARCAMCRSIRLNT